VSTYDYDKERETFTALYNAIDAFKEANIQLHATMSRMRIQTERLIERVGALEEKIEGDNELVFTREQIVSIIHDTVDGNYFDDNFDESVRDLIDEKIESHNDYKDHPDEDDIESVLLRILGNVRIEPR
jgi:hypothetical protein